MSLSRRSLASLARRLQWRLEVRPSAVVMLPSGMLPVMRVAAPTRPKRVERAVATRARLEVLRAWRMRSWAICCSMLGFELGLAGGVRLCIVGEGVEGWVKRFLTTSNLELIGVWSGLGVGVV